MLKGRAEPGHGDRGTQEVDIQLNLEGHTKTVIQENREGTGDGTGAGIQPSHQGSNAEDPKGMIWAAKLRVPIR